MGLEWSGHNLTQTGITVVFATAALPLPHRHGGIGNDSGS
jgi:hypothetical protein